MTAMDITIHASFLPHNDPDASLAFYRDTLGFEVRNDVGYGGMRWITVGPADQPGTSIVLHPPGADPGITDDERRTIAEMMAKGTYAVILLATTDLDGTFARLQASDAEVVQEPTEQPYGVRDCAVRDPAGNLIRIQESALSRLAMAAMTCTDGTVKEPAHDVGDGYALDGEGDPAQPYGDTMSKSTTKDTQSPATHVADSHDLIRVHGARENNLKDVSVENRSAG